MTRIAALCLLFVLFTGLATAAEPAVKTFGKAPTLTDATPVAKLNSAPPELVDHDVLVAGKIVDMCAHKGCWVEVEDTDGARIICKSLDESVTFSKDCKGQSIRLQGKLMYDPKAPGVVEEKHGDEHAEPDVLAAPGTAIAAETPATDKAAVPPHACPAPKVLVSIQGATVEFAAAKE